MSPHIGWMHVGVNSAVYDVAEHFKNEQSLARVFDWFAHRDRSEVLPSSFGYARDALPDVIRGVFSGLYQELDGRLP